MFKLGLASVLALAVFRGAEAQHCGSTVVANDFNRYSGAYQSWSQDDAAVDFS